MSEQSRRQRHEQYAIKRAERVNKRAEASDRFHEANARNREQYAEARDARRAERAAAKADFASSVARERGRIRANIDTFRAEVGPIESDYKVERALGRTSVTAGSGATAIVRQYRSRSAFESDAATMVKEGWRLAGQSHVPGRTHRGSRAVTRGLVGSVFGLGGLGALSGVLSGKRDEGVITATWIRGADSPPSSGPVGPPVTG